MPRGTLTLVPGNMFSGKTEFLIEDMIPRLEKYAKKKVLLLKPVADTRSGTGKIKTKPGKRPEEKTMDAIEVPTDSMSRILGVIKAEEEKAKAKLDVLVFDETQFFESLGFYRLIKQLLHNGYDIVAVGLERDFRDDPFGPIPYLKIIKDCVITIIDLDSRTYCMKCGRPMAHYPQRLLNGKPAHYNSPQVFVGGAESYEARCIKCHKVPGRLRIKPS